MIELSGKDKPGVKTVATTAGTLVSTDTGMRNLHLENTGSNKIWLAVLPNTAVVGRGIGIAGGTWKNFDKDSIPLRGLSAIADGGSSTVAIQKG